jgi:putative phosphoesterase
MLVGILSDTHIPDAVMEMPSQLKRVFNNVDMILHAGDIFVVSVLDELEQLAPVLAACGDSEYLETRNDPRVQERQELSVDGVTIWVCHDASQLKTCAEETLPDIIVGGHTHWPAIERRGRQTWINPGSATYPEYQTRPGTVALLSIRNGKIDGEILSLV